MFIKIPVYFEIDGSFRDLGFIQEALQLFLEKQLLGRKTSLPVDLDWKKALPAEAGEILSVKLIKRDRVIDGFR
jgi:hypothetical protein